MDENDVTMSVDGVRGRGKLRAKGAEDVLCSCEVGKRANG